ncbi:MAG: hypothetical protein M1353_07885 [Nitrospirae bacterium]|nr:hypothetical protein [Nitrospirota bacterium]
MKHKKKSSAAADSKAVKGLKTKLRGMYETMSIIRYLCSEASLPDDRKIALIQELVKDTTKEAF